MSPPSVTPAKPGSSFVRLATPPRMDSGFRRNDGSEYDGDMALRPIDHLVLAVRDLDAARATYGRLGFTLTPVARHPFGTANSLIQLNGA